MNIIENPICLSALFYVCPLLDHIRDENDWLLWIPTRLNRSRASFFSAFEMPPTDRLDLARASRDMSDRRASFSLKAHIHNSFSFTKKTSANIKTRAMHTERPSSPCDTHKGNPRKYQKIMNETQMEFVDFFPRSLARAQTAKWIETDDEKEE